MDKKFYLTKQSEDSDNFLIRDLPCDPGETEAVLGQSTPLQQNQHNHKCHSRPCPTFYSPTVDCNKKGKNKTILPLSALADSAFKYFANSSCLSTGNSPLFVLLHLYLVSLLHLTSAVAGCNSNSMPK